MPIVAKYEFTPCARQAIRECYPKETSEPQFSRDQRFLQEELIRCHYTDMDEETKKRAIKTLDFLEKSRR